MKKLTILLAFVTISLLGYAQSNSEKIPPEPIERSSFSIGAIGGFGHSFIMPYDNNVFCPSWDAGISAIYSPWKHWGVGMDLLYSVEGAKFRFVNGAYESPVYTIRTELD